VRGRGVEAGCQQPRSGRGSRGPDGFQSSPKTMAAVNELAPAAATWPPPLPAGLAGAGRYDFPARQTERNSMPRNDGVLGAGARRRQHPVRCHCLWYRQLRSACSTGQTASARRWAGHSPSRPPVGRGSGRRTVRYTSSHSP
jgi:hypothetical protein